MIKHIPGLGRAAVDSHTEPPYVRATLKELGSSDFRPFQDLCLYSMGMTTHVIFEALDQQPATVSPTVISLIRDEIGFDGLLMTDDISMEALNGPVEERSRSALDAGCDVTLHCNGQLEEMRKIATLCPLNCAKAAERMQRVMDQHSALSELVNSQKMVKEGGCMTDDTVPSQGVLEIADRLEAENLIIDIDGFEGPLDLLLSLSRSQKVDLLKISVLELARQYLDFIEQAKALRIELAADYLVMAAWLAYLKSRLLLPPEQQDDGPTGEELAAHLAFQLERLQAMRSAAAQLMARDQKGRNFFQRGVPEKFELVRRVTYTASLLDLMQAYSRVRTRDEFRPFVMDRQNVFTMEEALERLRGLVGYALDWVDLASYLPSDWTDDPLRRRAATAATFAASLELAKAGRVEIRQRGTFEPIELKRKTAQT